MGKYKPVVVTQDMDKQCIMWMDVCCSKTLDPINMFMLCFLNVLLSFIYTSQYNKNYDVLSYVDTESSLCVGGTLYSLTFLKKNFQNS